MSNYINMCIISYSVLQKSFVIASTLTRKHVSQRKWWNLYLCYCWSHVI